MSASHINNDALRRLEILWRKLDDEGRYVSASTVSLAITEIERQHDAISELMVASRCALGYLTGNMDGDMDLGDPIKLLRNALDKADGSQ